MIVVSDTSILIVLSQMRQLSLLPLLFEEIAIPEVVRIEYEMRPEQDGFVELSKLPWITIHDINRVNQRPDLGKGEAAAIELALEIEPDFLLIDDRRGRSAASELGIPVIGTIGVLELAAKSGLGLLEDYFSVLRTTSMFFSHKFLAERLAAFQLWQNSNRQQS
jgi:hypothetical protein